ncbi:chromate transporter [Reticulibacter mediterranei]|uniref:Chromate transporter n=2 Tax=Reticulibacter mediterranei TaxID=2778369 RepID=A0A8J3IST6_9CHLR|nr:chromate transporter [Reticulibacter mediterranei]
MKEAQPNWRRFARLMAVFSYIGLIGFGGALGPIGLMETSCVKRRHWLGSEAFQEGLVIATLFPGATALQLAVYIGSLYAGPLGGLLSGISFLLPAFLLMLSLSWLYVLYGTWPIIEAGFTWIGPVVVAIIMSTLYEMGRGSLKTLVHWSIGCLACLGVLFPIFPLFINLPIILLSCGVLGMILYGRGPSPPPPTKSSSPVTLHSFVMLPLAFQAFLEGVPPLLSLAVEFFKVGFLLFGCGFVMIPFLQQELVEHLHWLTTQQLLDGIALAQITPGPFLVVATFIGYKSAGIAGALTATGAVFTPSFLLASVATPLLLRIRHSPRVKGFFQGVTPAVLGVLTASIVLLAQTTIIDGWTLGIAMISFSLLFLRRVHPAFLIGGALILGMLHVLVTPS